jgi:hypothetical protein
VEEPKDALSGTLPKSYMVVLATPAYVKTVKLLEKLTHTGKHQKATEKFLDKLTREYRKVPSDDSCDSSPIDNKKTPPWKYQPTEYKGSERYDS